jgi:16S rRNA (cytosine1402-N4)-methyltransferase
MHVPVLFDAALAALNIQPNQTYVDMTLGGAGHARAILDRLDDGVLIGFDQDLDAITRAKKMLDDPAKNVELVHANFAELNTHLERLGISKVHGILFDLGVSSFHFDEADRGFSYRLEGPLDMRMDQSQTLTAEAIINTYEPRDLLHILFSYGEESMARQIVKAIVKARDLHPITRTEQLVGIIKSALPAKRLSQKGHPAKQTFQALRIAVNRELDVLKDALNRALDALDVGGRCVVISFHSLEDRIVKHTFKNASSVVHPEGLPTMPQTQASFQVTTRKPILPTEEECALNPRAKSAKMRVIERISKD